MARTIWKFTLPLLDRPVLVMPGGAILLTAAAQGEQVCVWANVDPDAEKVPREFHIAGTGHVLPAWPGTYVGTAHLAQGSLVLHVFDQGERGRD